MPIHLTTRERQTLKLLASGKSQKEIADKMQVTPRTIDTYLKRVKEKTGLHKATELVAVWWATHNNKKAIKHLVLQAGQIMFIVANFCLLLYFSLTQDLPTQTSINQPAAGGLEGLFILIIAVAVVVVLFHEDYEGFKRIKKLFSK